MIIPVGTLVNVGAVIAGGSLGLLAGGIISERLRNSLFQTLGLCTILIGLKMALTAESPILIILSCVFGMVTGELIRLNDRLDSVGNLAKRLLRSNNENFTNGLVNASLLFCVGAMAIVGSFEEGLGVGSNTLFSKSILDFCAALMLASVYGGGVLGAAGVVLIYQLALTFLAATAAPYLTEEIETALTATGGLMVMAIGTNLLGVKAINVSNLLPALGFAVLFGAVF